MERIANWWAVLTVLALYGALVGGLWYWAGWQWALGLVGLTIWLLVGMYAGLACRSEFRR